MDVNSSSWSILRNSHSQIDMFFKIVVKIFENFTGKHLCWSLFLINFITNRLRHRLFLVKFAKFLWTSFYRTPPPTASVFSKDFFHISYENSHARTRRLYVSASYLFLKYNSMLVYGTYFSDWWEFTLANYFQSVTEFTLRFLYRLISHYGKFTTLHKLISIVLQLTNQMG